MTKPKAKDAIIIDPEKDWVFTNEKDLFAFFKDEILSLEDEYVEQRRDLDYPPEEAEQMEHLLTETLDQPDEIWLDDSTCKDKELHIYIKEFEKTAGDYYFYIAITHQFNGMPTFMYLHFPTRDEALMSHYRRGEMLYDKLFEEAPLGALDGDALLEKDELAVGLYDAMLLVRSEGDIEEKDFRDFGEYREMSIEEADEIWRSNDSMGNTLVTFVKDLSDQEKDLHYVVVTVEDVVTDSHALLFSFPTKDHTLLERYRHGENLQAEEIVQESSH